MHVTFTDPNETAFTHWLSSLECLSPPSAASGEIDLPPAEEPTPSSPARVSTLAPATSPILPPLSHLNDAEDEVVIPPDLDDDEDEAFIQAAISGPCQCT